MQCRSGCGACCIAPSIATPFHGMPGGKPAGVPCVHLTAEKHCALFGDPRRPALCEKFQPEAALCGSNAVDAMANLIALERSSAPVASLHPRGT